MLISINKRKKFFELSISLILVGHSIYEQTELNLQENHRGLVTFGDHSAQNFSKN